MTQVIHNVRDSWSERELYRQPVCVKCSQGIGQIVRFLVKRNGVFIPYGHDSAQSGDLLVCPVCHIEIVQGFSIILGKSVSTQVLGSEYAILQDVYGELVQSG